MINKKNVLGKKPHELGTKDAIHTAIVAVRAGEIIKPGQKCKINEFNEAVPASGKALLGVADPFLEDLILVGDEFWLLLNQDSIPNVMHVWEHPKVKFDPPTREVQMNDTIGSYAKDFGVSYKEIMDACSKACDGKPVPYPGKKTIEEIEEVIDSLYYLWSEWSSITGYEFENYGSGCCPEYNYPKRLFTI